MVLYHHGNNTTFFDKKGVWVHWTSRSYLHTVPAPKRTPHSIPPQCPVRQHCFRISSNLKKKRTILLYILSFMFLCMCHILGNRFPGRSGWPSVSTVPPFEPRSVLTGRECRDAIETKLFDKKMNQNFAVVGHYLIIV